MSLVCLYNLILFQIFVLLRIIRTLKPKCYIKSTTQARRLLAVWKITPLLDQAGQEEVLFAPAKPLCGETNLLAPLVPTFLLSFSLFPLPTTTHRKGVQTRHYLTPLRLDAWPHRRHRLRPCSHPLKSLAKYLFCPAWIPGNSVPLRTLVLDRWCPSTSHTWRRDGSRSRRRISSVKSIKKSSFQVQDGQNIKANLLLLTEPVYGDAMKLGSTSLRMLRLAESTSSQPTRTRNQQECQERWWINN